VGRQIDGGLAEYVKLPARNLCRIPPELGYVDGVVTADAIAPNARIAKTGPPEGIRNGPDHRRRGRRGHPHGSDGQGLGRSGDCRWHQRRKACLGTNNPDAELTFNPRLLVGNEIVITGSRYCSREDLARTVDMVACGRIRPIVTRTCKLEEADDILRMIERKELAGRAAVIMP
jgi:D-arabinose 1-dehydrogenase-like Zn-dependent alcohol dehydrogenase